MPKTRSTSRSDGVDTEFLDLRDARIDEPQRIAASKHGMVATAHYAATAAGVRMLEQGGNAIDAAVAAALALGVVEPAASGLGGQTMMLVHHRESRRTFALDGSSRAPYRALIDAFDRIDVERRRGHRATTVPSSPAVYDYAVKHYGSLEWANVVEPAIALARDGYPVSLLQRRLTRRERKYLRANSGALFFLGDRQRSFAVGSIFRQPVLARTLERLQRKGVDDFYLGETAELIHRDMEANGGFIRRDDLAQIPYPIERRPVTGRFDGSRVFTMPLPGAGRTLIEMLNVHQQLTETQRDIESPRGAVLLAETIRRAFLDRKDRPFDPNSFSQASDKVMLKVDYAKAMARQITRKFGHGETTHLSVMDSHGNVVALTQSIENVYGSCAASPDLGFLYNNYMSAFEYEDASHPYYLRPTAVPWASVAPTIVFRGRRPWLAIGSPGSERITSSILQVLIRLKRMTPLTAVDAPRLHCSLQGRVSLEAARMRSDIPEALERKGFTLDIREPYSFYLGCVQLVMWDHGTFIGVADPRRDGAAAGPAPGGSS